MNFRDNGHCSDQVDEIIQVAAVTKPKPPPDQLEDLLRRLIVNMAAPVPVSAPVQEVWAAAELRQRLVAEIHSLKPQPTPDQLEDQFRWLLSNRAAPVTVPAPVPRVPTVNKLLWRRVAETQSRQPTAVSSPEPVGFGSYLSGQQTSGPQIRWMPVERNRDGVGCFSCGESGHAVTRCPNLNESFPFMQPGWRAEKTPGGGGGGGGGSL